MSDIAALPPVSRSHTKWFAAGALAVAAAAFAFITAGGIGDNLVRLSVGVESIEDLRADVERALA